MGSATHERAMTEKEANVSGIDIHPGGKKCQGECGSVYTRLKKNGLCLACDKLELKRLLRRVAQGR